MYKLTYLIGGKPIQEFYFPNYALCKWKAKQLKSSGWTSGTFKIEMQ